MKVSIITATYNSAKHIESVIDSISYQNYTNIEWVVIDGASTDNTIAIIKEKFLGNLKLISEKDKGIYDALNKGVTHASGEIIGFLHSDDFFYSSETISKIVENVKKNNSDGIYGNLNYVSSSKTHNIIRKWKSKPFTLPLLNKGWMPPHPTLFLKKEVYDKYGLFDTSFKISADYDFILRIMNNKSLKLDFIPEVITNMRTGGASNKLGNLLTKLKEDKKALKKNQIRNILFVLVSKNFSKIKQFIFPN